MRRSGLMLVIGCAALAATSVGAQSGKTDTKWTLLSTAKLAGAAASPSVARDGGKIVVAALTAPTTAQATTFTPSKARDVVSPSHKPLAKSSTQLGNPELLDKQGGGLQALIEGLPTFGVSFAPRNPDGSFGAPVAAVDNIRSTATGPPVLAPDGAPVWPASYGGDLWLWRGATGATGTNPGAGLPGNEGFPSMGRDSKGRYWVTWYQLAPTAKASGVRIAQFDPLTLKLVGAPQRPPSSGAATNNARRAAFACANVCRVVYLQTAGAVTRIVSWAPGERAAARVASVRGSVLFPVASYTTNRRLWIAWWNPAAKRYEAVLGNAAGAGGKVVSVGKPAGKGDAGALAAIASGSNLVLVASWLRGQSTSRFVNVVSSAR